MEAYLKGTCSSLPQATEASGLGCAAWLGKVYEGVVKGYVLGSLPQATWGRGCRDTEGSLPGTMPQCLEL